MSGNSSDSEEKFINSTLTEIVVLLLFSFMLVSMYYGAKAKSLMDQIANSTHTKPPTQTQPPTPASPPPQPLARSKDLPNCLRKGAKSPWLFEFKQLPNRLMRVRLNDQFEEFSGRKLPDTILRNFTSAQGWAVEMSMSQIHILARDIESKSVDKEAPDACAYAANVEEGKNNKELSGMFTLTYGDIRK